MKIALIHDYFTEMGGAERVVELLLPVFPEAPVYTSVYNPAVTAASFADRDIRTTFIQRITKRKPLTKALFPLFPLAFRSFDLSDYDVVLSSSSGFAHHVRVRDDALHVCYCHNPPRFLWQQPEYFRTSGSVRRLIAPALVPLRRLDVAAAARVDAYLANSRTVAERIERAYGRQAEVMNPPVDASRFRLTDERSGRFLVVSRLLAYKRIDLVVEAATRRGLPLDVIGDGPDRGRLEAMAGATVRFLGRQSNEAVSRAMATATALIMPGREDFGLTVVESQASGRPPVAYAAGGALETIDDGRTGFLFREQNWEAVAEAMERAQATELPSGVLRAVAERLDIAVFGERLTAFLERQLKLKRADAARKVAAPARHDPG